MPVRVHSGKITSAVACFCVLTVGLSSAGVKAIDCFKCVSHNGDNAACEDPFHHNYTSELLHQPCLAGRKGREGLFPATACVKVTGTFEDSGDTMVVRTCALDSGTLTVDTELVRMSHCGSFYFDDRYVRGCVVSCTSDACNSAQGQHSARHSMPFAPGKEGFSFSLLSAFILVASTALVHLSVCDQLL